MRLRQGIDHHARAAFSLSLPIEERDHGREQRLSRGLDRLHQDRVEPVERQSRGAGGDLEGGERFTVLHVPAEERRLRRAERREIEDLGRGGHAGDGQILRHGEHRRAKDERDQTERVGSSVCHPEGLPQVAEVAEAAAEEVPLAIRGVDRERHADASVRGGEDLARHQGPAGAVRGEIRQIDRVMEPAAEADQLVADRIEAGGRHGVILHAPRVTVVERGAPFCHGAACRPEREGARSRGAPSTLRS
jgi:hypothetical protein